MPSNWTDVLWGAGLGTALTIVLLNMVPDVAPYVKKAPPAKTA